MVELYIVRHGETDTNYTGKINGSSTNLDLNDTGVKQVNYLKNNLNINDFDEIISSPLKRAFQTAEILNQNTHNIQTDNRLREINYGAWDGLSASEVMDKYPDCFDDNHYLSENYSDYSKDAETFKSVLERLQDFIQDMTQKNDEKILVVCHGFVTRSFVQLATQMPNIERILEVPNASVTKIKIADNKLPYLAYYGRLENI